MRKIVFIILIAVLSPLASAADDFASKLDLSPLETISLQHRQTVKTFDSFARQMITTITGRGSLDGKPAVFTIIDMAVNPADYENRNIVKIKNVPLRQDFQRLENISAGEKKRIIEEGTVSVRFLFRPEVNQLMEELESQAVFKASAVGQARGAASTMAAILRGFANFPPAAIITPATDGADDHKWKRLDEVAGNVQAYAESLKQSGQPVPAIAPNYDQTKLDLIAKTLATMVDAWHNKDAATVNAQVASLASQLPAVTPSQYPSAFKRNVEVTYNRLMKLTIPASALYFFAFVCFLMCTNSGVNSLRIWGLRLFAVGLIIHTLGIGIRWWLVAAQHGNWFDGIPIKNQFESVLFSAWFGAMVGFILELTRRNARGMFGAAASFVGWLSLTAIFATPYVTGTDIGGEIGQVQGVLMSYWLYIHVTMVTASYALIGMAFLLGIWWLVTYYRAYGTVRRVPSVRISSDAGDIDAIGDISGGAISLSPWQTIARMLFFPVSSRGLGVSPALKKSRSAESLGRDAQATNLLARLDACNLVVLQLAFWILGVGVILGAIWADQSWGRPWGWDPKETFALVTWIVYLIVVHVRIATVDKAWWTSVLSILGFFVMLFNWIGVNFFLVGLHSYA